MIVAVMENQSKWKYEPITRSEERVLIRKAQSGCDESMNRLFTGHLPWWLKKSKEFIRYQLSITKADHERNLAFETDDLFGICFVNFKRAVISFRLDMNCRLLTYCGNRTWMWFNRFVQEECKPLMLCDQQYIEETQPAGNDTTLRIDAENQNRHQKQMLAEALEVVATTREKEIINLRFFCESPLTLRQVGQRMGLTKQRISQIQNQCFFKLKEYLESNEMETVSEYETEDKTNKSSGD